jgi:hypothetical protein
MSRLFNRILDTGADIFRRVSGTAYARETRQAMTSHAFDPSSYELRDLMLEGSIYQTTRLGGALKQVLKSIGRPCGGQDEAKYPISGYYNPVKPIVGFYSNAFGGRLGGDLKLADKVNGREVNKAMADVVAKVWRWSNLDHRTAEMTTLAANHGTVGVRIVKTDGPNARVYLDFDHPAFIKAIDLDNRGNVQSVFLEYTGVRTLPDGTNETFKVEEVISREGFSQQFDGEEQLTPDRQKNPLGLCPYVLIRHDIAPGEVFGRHAYFGSERMIHGINFGLSQLDQSIVEHVWPYLFASAAAKKPVKYTTGRYTLIYAENQEGKPQATFNALAPPLPFQGAIAHIQQLVDMVRDRQPQLVLSEMGLLSGISGETLAQVLKPAESESVRARALYEDGIVRAIQIAASIGIFSGMDGFNLGTGSGKDGADRAYDDGQGPEAFAFADRPAIQPTVFQKIQQANANVADRQAKMTLANTAKDVSVEERLRIAGYSDKEIQNIIAEKSRLVPTEPL